VIVQTSYVLLVRSLKSAKANASWTHREHESTTLEVLSTGVAIAVTQSVWPTSTPRYLRVSDIATLFAAKTVQQADSTQAWKRATRCSAWCLCATASVCVLLLLHGGASMTSYLKLRRSYARYNAAPSLMVYRTHWAQISRAT
jgi:hypothetical protein